MNEAILIHLYAVSNKLMLLKFKIFKLYKKFRKNNCFEAQFVCYFYFTSFDAKPKSADFFY